MPTVGAQQPRLVAQRDQRYYVSVKDDRGRTGYLLGPYDGHEEALANVRRANDLACDADRRAVFYSFGTCSVPADRTIRTVFGK